MNELKMLFEQARKGSLPSDFDQWGLSDESTRTVAHVAASEGHLPPDFDRWDLKDVWGISVAHVAAKHGHLPADFDQWDLKDGFGLSVAHEAALSDDVHPLVTSGISPSDLGKWFRTENYQNYLKRTRKTTARALVILRTFERSR